MDLVMLADSPGPSCSKGWPSSVSTDPKPTACSNLSWLRNSSTCAGQPVLQTAQQGLRVWMLFIGLCQFTRFVRYTRDPYWILCYICVDTYSVCAAGKFVRASSPGGWKAWLQVPSQDPLHGFPGLAKRIATPHTYSSRHPPLLQTSTKLHNVSSLLHVSRMAQAGNRDVLRKVGSANWAEAEISGLAIHWCH